MGRCLELASEHGADSRLHCLADPLLPHHAHHERRLRRAVTMSVLPVGSMHCCTVVRHAGHGEGGVARGTVVLATKSVLQAMAVRGLQLQGPEAALEQSCGRVKLEQARSMQ